MIGLFVTGEDGSMGSAIIRRVLANTPVAIVNLDALTYAPQPRARDCVEGDGRYYFVRGDISNAGLVPKLLGEHQPSALISFAMQSHVVRSVTVTMEFARTDIQGTFTLLEASRRQSDEYRYVCAL